VFFISAGISVDFIRDALRMNGMADWFLVVFFGLGAIFLPFLVRNR
jgi:hypothetical protein